jgi:hypothetical protein
MDSGARTMVVTVAATRARARRKAITAIAHTLLKIAYQVLKTGTPHQGPGADFYTRPLADHRPHSG